MRSSVRARVRIVGGLWGGSRKPWAASATRRAWARESDARVAGCRDGERTDANLAGAGDRPPTPDGRDVVRKDDFRPRGPNRLAHRSGAPQNSRMHRGDVWGSRLVGRVTATTAALALAGTAVVLMGQGRSGAALQAAADSATAKTTAPSAATIEIVQDRPVQLEVQPEHRAARRGRHSDRRQQHRQLPTRSPRYAAGNNGNKLFNVELVRPGATKTVGADSDARRTAPTGSTARSTRS